MTNYNDYLFLLEPSDAVKKQIAHYKLKASEHIGVYPGARGSAHVSICLIERQKPHIINTFINSIKNRIHSMPPVMLQINGFEYFVHGEDHMTIYAAIKPTYKTDNWFALLKKQLNIKKQITPHITITKHIPADAFYKLWPELRLHPYKESFTVDKLTILVRETFKPDTRYEVYDRLYFKNELKY